MSKETNHLHDVLEMLKKLSDHYQNCSLEWAQKKEQDEAEWDALLDGHVHEYEKVEANTFDGEFLGYVMECDCGDVLSL